jgi:hypothetical protein
MLERVNSEFFHLFPQRTLAYFWQIDGRIAQRDYQFEALPLSALDNKKLGLGGKTLLEVQPLSAVYKDLIALLLLGGAARDEKIASVLSKCEISRFLGQPDRLEKFIRQRYIWVSRITGGSQSNNLGQLAQTFVQEYLETNLAIDGVSVKRNGRIPGIKHTGESDKRETTFDLVVSREGKYVAVEVSFQVTTNSVIERKSGQAWSRYKQIQMQGHKIAYVLDGAGNFKRKSALRTICTFSDCTVAFSRNELELLCQFIREYLTRE